MKLLLEINSYDAGLGERESFIRDYNLRKASRAVVFNDDNKIAILYAPKTTTTSCLVAASRQTKMLSLPCNAKFWKKLALKSPFWTRSA